MIWVSVKMAPYPLYRREEVPPVFWEVGIREGYRKPHSSAMECIRSAFMPTNETMNFWTHFLPFWYFLWQLRKMCTDDPNFKQDTYHWPYLAYVWTMICCPIASCLAHLFNVLSADARHICFFLDYTALSCYSFGSAVVYHAYCFDAWFFNTWYSGIFPYLTAVLALSSTFLACQSRYVCHPRLKKVMRISAFAVPMLFTCSPLWARMAHCALSGCPDPAIAGHARHFLWAILALAFYGFHIPECFAPGRFDILGHSHQIFHVLCMLASYDQMWACHTDMKNRRALFEAEGVLPSGRIDFWLVIAIIACNFAIAGFFIGRLLRQREGSGGLRPVNTADGNLSAASGSPDELLISLKTSASTGSAAIGYDHHPITVRQYSTSNQNEPGVMSTPSQDFWDETFEDLSSYVCLDADLSEISQPSLYDYDTITSSYLSDVPPTLLQRCKTPRAE